MKVDLLYGSLATLLSASLAAGPRPGPAKPSGHRRMVDPTGPPVMGIAAALVRVRHCHVWTGAAFRQRLPGRREAGEAKARVMLNGDGHQQHHQRGGAPLGKPANQLVKVDASRVTAARLFKRLVDIARRRPVIQRRRGVAKHGICARSYTEPSRRLHRRRCSTATRAVAANKATTLFYTQTNLEFNQSRRSHQVMSQAISARVTCRTRLPKWKRPSRSIQRSSRNSTT